MQQTKMKLDSLGRMVIEKRGNTSVRQAADEAGMSYATLSRIENGKLPDLQNFALVCRWLGVTPNDLMGF